MLAGFWMGGFEGADHVNAAGEALDLVRASGHEACLDADHARAAKAGLSVVRESIGWRLAEPEPGRYDWTRALRIADSAQRNGLQVLWTLMHYGLPLDLSLHDDALIDRFERFAAAAARVLGRSGGRPPVVTPINEIGYLAWCASQPGLLHPPNNLAEGSADSAASCGYAVKRRLVRAALAAMAAMRRVRPGMRFLHVEPLVHVVAPPGRPDLEDRAREVAGWQWQVWDLLSGRSEPALGGAREWMHALGANHYHSSQWELATERRLPWHEQDPRRRPLQHLLQAAWQRYRVPLLLAETSHVGVGRAAWLHDVADEVRRARAAGVPVQGLCLYPLLDRPDWNEPRRWHRSGLWHVPAGRPHARAGDPDYLSALRAWRRALPEPATQPLRPRLLVLAGSRWSSERPRRLQQLAARLAGRWQVVYVEPPRLQAQADCVQRFAAGPQLQVVVTRWRSPPSVAERLRTLCEAVELDGELPAIAWIERAEDAAEDAAIARALGCAALVGDAAVDGPGIFRLPPLDGVDLQAHRRAPCDDWNAEEARLLQPPVPGLRLGYVGPVDDALDLELLAAAAQARPGWQWIVCGEPHQCVPRRANLHALPEPPARIVPALMRGWDLALLPLRGGAARSMSSRVLTALASGLPVVGTAGLGDPASAACTIAQGLQPFLKACADAARESPPQRAQRRRAAQAALQGRDWATLADQLHRLLLSLLPPPFGNAECRAGGTASAHPPPCPIFSSSLTCAGPSSTSARSI